jgi:sugar phosphate isomerase/epimerase
MSVKWHRRTFLEQSAGLAAGLVAARASVGAAAAEPAVVAPRAATAPTVADIGLQLYTVRDEVAKDIDRALEDVAKVGYKVVEFAGYGTRTPEQIRDTLKRLGMRAPSTHIALTAIRSDFDAQVRIAETLGHAYITVPSLGNDTPTTSDGWKKIADEFNAIAKKLQPHHIGLGFHSHRDEYMAVGGGQTGLDVFITGTDPALVAFEMDLGWAEVAGQNPLEWFTRYPGRFKMWHVKDILALDAARAEQRKVFARLDSHQPAPPAPPAAPAGAAPPAVTGGPVPVGAGEIDYRPILAGWQQSGLEYFFVEQDSGPVWPGGSLVAIATSYRNLVNLLR